MDEKTNDPYEIIGVSKYDSLDDITFVYKKLALTLHPDKMLTAEDIAKGWTEEEKNKAFLIVSDAYTQIVKEKKAYTNAPTSKQIYENDYFIDGNREFNAEKFNREFEEKIKNENDPYKKGYVFNTRNVSNGPIGSQHYTEMSDIKADEQKKGTIMEYTYHDPFLNDLYVDTSMNSNSLHCTELGLSNITDFSSKIGNMMGTDLMSVYKDNNEIWENTFKTSSEINKFNDTNNINVNMNKLKEQRENEIKFDENFNQKLKEEKQLKENIMKERKENYLRGYLSNFF